MPIYSDGADKQRKPAHQQDDGAKEALGGAAGAMLGGAAGYAAQSAALTPSAGWVEITASVLNVRLQPTSKGFKAGTLLQGAKVEKTGVSGSWVEISFEGRKAYVYGKYTQPTSGGGGGGAKKAPTPTETPTSERTVEITAAGLNVRSKPTTAGNTRVGTVKRGDQLTVIGESGKWLKVIYQGQAAYISGKYTKSATPSPSKRPDPKPVESKPVEAKPDAPATEGPQVDPASGEIEVTSSALNVRSKPSSSGNSPIGKLTQGQRVEVTGYVNGWARIKYNGKEAYVSAKYTKAPGGEAPGGGGEVEEKSSVQGDYGEIVSQLVTDYQNVPVWNKGQSASEPAAATFRTPYVLNTPKSVQDSLSAQYGKHKSLKTRDGKTVGSSKGSRAFIGKGTPAEVQMVAQAAIDAGKTTAGGMQAYINAGPMNGSGSRRNGKWGVDCSGFTAIARAEMGGKSRSDGYALNLRSTAYRPGGEAFNKGFTQLTPDTAQPGDVVSYMHTNHVVVVSKVTTVDIPGATAGDAKRKGIKLKVGESSGSGIRETTEFIHVPGAYSYAGVKVKKGPDWTLFKQSGALTWKTSGGQVVIPKGTYVKKYSIVRSPENTPIDTNETKEKQAGES